MTSTPARRGFLGKRSHHAAKPVARVEGEVVVVNRVVVAGPPPLQPGDIYPERVWRPKSVAA